MPFIENSGLGQKAVLWEATSRADAQGKPKVSSPVEISVRWKAGRRQMADPNGNTISYDASVVVDQTIPVGSIMWLGEQTDLPSPLRDLFQVIASNDSPNLKSTRSRKLVKLQRYGNALPTVAS